MELPYKSIFFVGIKGVAMANLARMFQQMGKKVTGSDVKDSFITDEELSSSQIEIIYSFSKEKLPKEVDLVVYSAAHGGTNNPQVIEAEKRGTPVKHQAEVIGELIKRFSISVAVAGCHGKTTTSALLSYALTKLKEDPSYLVGVSTFNDMFGGEFKGSTYFVVEADEYALNPPEDKTPKFSYFDPTHLLVTNIDFDHPDVYKNMKETQVVFERFMKETLRKKHSRIIACLDDHPLKEVLANVMSERVITYGINKQAHIKLLGIQTQSTSTIFDVEINLGNHKQKKVSFNISLFGSKNILNAVGAIAVLLELGFDPEKIKKAIKGFKGAKRRFELKQKIKDTYILDDYGHHPHEIEATIQAARMRFPEKRIVLIFQPHTFSRTEKLKEAFIHALAQADKTYLLPVFASARETKTETVTTSKDLARLGYKNGIHFIHSYDSEKELLHVLEKELKKGDVIFTMGAGDVYKMEEKIAEIIGKI